MAIYRNVQMTFWTDSKVVDNFTPEDRYFYLYLLTNPHTNLCGCYEISYKQISDETGYTKEVVEKLLDRMENIHNVIRYSNINKELLVINWSKFNWTKSNDFQKCLTKEIERVKTVDFKAFLIDTVDRLGTVIRPSIDPVGTTDTVYINNNITESINTNKKSKVFTKPTVDEVRAYCKERSNNVDAETFVDFYESKGWYVGKNPMKDWKAAVRTWERSRDNTTKKFNGKEIDEVGKLQRQEYRDYQRQLDEMLGIKK